MFVTTDVGLLAVFLDHVLSLQHVFFVIDLSLILLVLEAGIDIDVSSLKLIGTRGFLIAIVGSVLPIAIGIVLAIAMRPDADATVWIAAGATFGPTSLGIGRSSSISQTRTHIKSNI